MKKATETQQTLIIRQSLWDLKRNLSSNGIQWTMIIRQSLWDLKHKCCGNFAHIYHIIRQSLWDLKQYFQIIFCECGCYYKTVPMGFETTNMTKKKQCLKHYKTVPMGFETFFFLRWCCSYL